MKAISSSLLLALLNAGSALVVGIVMARWLGPNGQGELSAAMTIGAVTTLVLPLGTGTAMRLVDGPDEAHRVRAFVLFSMGAGFLAGLLATPLCVAIGLDPAPAAAAGAVAALMLLGRQSSDYVQARGHVYLSIASVGLGSCVQLLFVLLLRLTGQITLTGCFCGLGVGALVQSAVCIWLGGRPLLDSRGPMAPVLRELVAIGWPTLGFGLGLLLLQRADRLVVATLAGSQANGYYSMAATVAEGARLLSVIVGQVLFVRVAQAGRIGRDVLRLAAVALVLQAAFSIAAGLAAPQIVDLLFGSQYQRSIGILPVLLLAESFMALGLLGSRLLMGVKQVKFVGLCTAVVASVSLVAYYFFVRGMGAMGAAIASCVVYGIFGFVVLAKVAQEIGQEKRSRNV